MLFGDRLGASFGGFEIGEIFDSGPHKLDKALMVNGLQIGLFEGLNETDPPHTRMRHYLLHLLLVYHVNFHLRPVSQLEVPGCPLQSLVLVSDDLGKPREGTPILFLLLGVHKDALPHVLSFPGCILDLLLVEAVCVGLEQETFFDLCFLLGVLALPVFEDCFAAFAASDGC